MKLVEMKCKNCGSILKADPESKEVTCKYCQTTFKIDDEVLHHKLDDAEQTGYEMEKGRLRAQREAKEEAEAERYARQQAIYQQEQKKKNLKWWILGWIFCFPIPLTILIWRNEKWEKNVKIILTILLWGLVLIIGYSSDSDTSTNNTTNNNTQVQENEKSTTDYVNRFITLFNDKSKYKITNIEKFNAKSEKSGHFRTEFRLNAWDNNISYSGKINNYVIDIIQYGNSYNSIRVYFSYDNLDVRNEVLKNTLNIIDSTISDQEIKELIDSTSRKSIVLGKSDHITGYVDNSELMIDSSSIDFK